MKKTRKILITGSNGQCGSALFSLPHEMLFFDRHFDEKYLPGGIRDSRCIEGDLGNLEALQAAMRGCDTVVHLAAASDINSNWEEVLQANIIGTRNVLEAARSLGVERVIFASTNHVVGMYELDNAPTIYELGHSILVKQDAELCPDSYYATSKVFGESLGKFFSVTGGPKFFALRIGALVREDHPYTHGERGVKTGKWERGSAQYELMVKRLKALWLSKRDFAQMVELCLSYDKKTFDTFYCVSNNSRNWLDITYPREALGYQPQDNGEDWSAPPQE